VSTDLATLRAELDALDAALLETLTIRPNHAAMAAALERFAQGASPQEAAALRELATFNRMRAQDSASAAARLIRTES
jgi:chorismate mutase